MASGMEDGQLTINRRSWAYMLAHPMRYGGHRPDQRTNISICALYARLLNMLLFAWPILLVYFLLATVVGSVFTLYLVGVVVYPSLRADGFLAGYPEPRPIFLGTVPATLLILAIWKWHALLHILGIIGWSLGCLFPVLLTIAIGVGIVLGLRAEEPNKVSVTAEYLGAKAKKFCKLVNFK